MVICFNVLYEHPFNSAFTSCIPSTLKYLGTNRQLWVVSVSILWSAVGTCDYGWEDNWIIIHFCIIYIPHWMQDKVIDNLNSSTHCQILWQRVLSDIETGSALYHKPQAMIKPSWVDNLTKPSWQLILGDFVFDRSTWRRHVKAWPNTELTIAEVACTMTNITLISSTQRILCHLYMVL